MSWIKKNKIFFVLIIVLVIFVIYFLTFRKKKPKEEFHKISKGKIMECIYGTGTINSNKTYQLKTAITSKVNDIFVSEGDFVEKGSKLALLETHFEAPFAGTITSIPYSPGETVFAGNTIVELTDLSDRYVSAIFDQSNILKIKKDQVVKFSIDAIRDNTFEGKVTSIYPYDNKFYVKIDIPRLPEKILPGMTGDIAIEIKELKDILLVPIEAIDRDKIYVKQINPLSHKRQFIKSVTIKIGVNDGKLAEVISTELKEGDEILLKNEGIK